MMLRRSLLGLIVLVASLPAYTQPVDQAFLDALNWRQVGPFRGGRSVAVSGVPGQPDHFYMGTTGGGVWKTVDAGKSWQCVTDGFFKTGSVGSIAVSTSTPDVVYVGMGETALRGNITHGDGVYRSDDAGKTWRHLGLTETQYISRVRVHPTDSETAWVAALGPVYGASDQRGVYKTTDGGQTWRKTLYVSDRAGAVDLTFHPENPDVVYAATWEAWRTPFTLNSGGPGSKIFKSLDGGETWSEITANSGLPTGTLGRIGIAVSPVDENRLYCMIEAEAGGLYSSNDAGESWTLVSQDSNIRQRPWYYTRVYAHPTEIDTVWVLNVNYSRSSDGGKTWRRGTAGHADHHDLWFDPTDPTRLAISSDGGVSVSIDDGRSWSAQTYPTAQFYHVTTDNAFPYRIYGAQQDNSTVRIASRTFGQGITTDDWESTAGGESGYIAVHPKNPDLVFGGNYGGTMDMYDHAKRLRRSVDPWPDNPMGHGAEFLTHRFQWTYPIVFSPHAPHVLYTTSQYVLRSRDLGQSWERISPDLTTNDKSKQKPSGGPITRDNTSVEYYCTIFAFAESPKKKGVLWAGSDDGLIHISTDDGGTWRNITPPSMPENGLVSQIDPSPFAEGTAWVAVDNHENYDHRPYVFVTRDFGRTWTQITNGLPDNSFVRVVREDPGAQNVLYAGLEDGIWISYDGGANWQQMRGNFPVVPVHDLVIKENDLVVATHGRSFWVLDDLSRVRQLPQLNATRLTLIQTAPVQDVRFGSAGGNDVGTNPLSGPVIRYWAPQATGELKFEVRDRQGTVVASRTVPESAEGMHEFSVRLQYPGFLGFAGMRLWSAGPSPIAAPPGTYTVVMTSGAETQQTTLRLLPDPRTGATERELVAKYELARKIADRTTEANAAVVRIRDIKQKANAAAEEDSTLADHVAKLNTQLSEVEDAIYQGKAQAGQDLLNYPIRLNNRLAALLSVVNSGSFGPTRQSYDVFDVLTQELDRELAKLRQIERTTLSDLNLILKEKGKPQIVGETTGLGQTGRSSGAVNRRWFEW